LSTRSQGPAYTFDIPRLVFTTLEFRTYIH
jgi:hypothetical protein